MEGNFHWFMLFFPTNLGQHVRVFELVKQKADSLQVSLEPQIVLSDFELTIKQAVELSFPTTDSRGCYYL